MTLWQYRRPNLELSLWEQKLKSKKAIQWTKGNAHMIVHQHGN